MGWGTKFDLGGEEKGKRRQEKSRAENKGDRGAEMMAALMEQVQPHRIGKVGTGVYPNPP